MELNKEQIIQALGCLNDKHDRICDICPVYKLTDRGYSSCRHVILDEALALIKELTEDNENLNETISSLLETIKSIRADTVREMAERWKERLPQLLMDCPYLDVLNEEFWLSAAYELFEDIDQITKEMLEETK